MSLELTQFNPVRSELASLKETNAALVFAYETKDGNKAARSHIYKLRQKRTDVEKIRKTAKADALEYGRQVDKVAGEIDGELCQMIEVHEKPLREIEAREEAIRAESERIEQEKIDAAARAEAERLKAIQDAERAEASRVLAELHALKLKQRDEQIAREAADKAKAEAEAKAMEAKQQEERRLAIASAKERLAREAVEKAERDKQQAILDAERAKVKALQDQIEAEKRAIQSAKDAEAKAESDRVEAARKALADKEAAIQRAVEEQKRRDQAIREATERQEQRRKNEEAARAKTMEVRRMLIRELVDSIREVIGNTAIDDPITILAAAMLDGKIKRVSVDTRIGINILGSPRS